MQEGKEFLKAYSQAGLNLARAWKRCPGGPGARDLVPELALQQVVHEVAVHLDELAGQHAAHVTGAGP